MKDFYPNRIVCLTEEGTETLYMLGEEDRIVGISGFTVRPKRARKEKPKVSLFTEASIDKIIELKPDLVLGFSDIQADIAKELIKAGVNVWISNHRSLKETLSYILQLGAMVGALEKAQQLVQVYIDKINQIKSLSSKYSKKPKVYFEEWYDPLISGIQWVSELIEICGGDDVYIENAQESLAKDRIIENLKEVIDRNPDIILASWCGKMFKKKKMLAREGWSSIQAIEDDEVFEIPSEIILQPGPAALTDGLDMIWSIITNWQKKHG